MQRNTILILAEYAVSVLGGFIVSIAVARAFAPADLGNYAYLSFLTAIAGTLGSLGIPATARKYMSEAAGRGRDDVFNAVYRVTIIYQCICSLVMTVGAAACAVAMLDRDQVWIAIVLILAMGVRMLSFMPSMVNVSLEKLELNVPGAVVGNCVMILSSALVLSSGGGLVGIAAAGLVGTAVECAMKFYPTIPRLRRSDADLLGRDGVKALRQVSVGNSLLSMISLVVFSRSDVFLLKFLSDSGQIAYFSISYSLIEKIQQVPTALANSLSVTQLVEYGRGRGGHVSLTTEGVRYICVLALPLCLGAGAIGVNFVPLVYGEKYLSMVSVFIVMAILGVAKPIVVLVQSLYIAYNDQKSLILWSALSGVANILIDVALIPGEGALGAAIGCGLSQLVLAVGLMMDSSRRYGFSWPVRNLRSVLVVGLVMVGGVGMLNVWMRGWFGLGVSVAAGAAIYAVGLRKLRVLTGTDFERLCGVGKRLGPRSGALYLRLLRWLIPNGLA